MPDVILASSSMVRARLLRAAGLQVETMAPRVDEGALRESLQAEAIKPRDIADALAEAKARKVSARNPGDLVLGCDQVLVHDNCLVSKSLDIGAATQLLKKLRGGTHQLLSAACIYRNGTPLWRHIGTAHLTMREFSDEYLDRYLARNWDTVRGAVGCYHIEDEGVRLFSEVKGDQFIIMGLPLLEILNFLSTRGDIDG
ncbi:Maf family protein [Roseicitreum antarcticum]|uniref:Nucleoside triphosphate pyrophosphatase n=1 Tax=Roseicitreum antarcticum TaxID=564137 RepID=A0A1H2QZ18_9RHOB|nr:Maf family protein [Roseicitreum antarcticum]SDW12407.1 septum formation protein [Roseicitreum antarcticum]